MEELKITGIECFAYHGCLEEEALIGCSYMVDVSFYGDFKKFKNKLVNLLRHNATQFKLVKYYAQVREALEDLAKTKEFITFRRRFVYL